ncbi:Crp/Fnr family transcriptional regulator [soil metagenome]
MWLGPDLSGLNSAGISGKPEIVTIMNVALDLQIQDKCQDCHLRNQSFFCDLPPDDLVKFESLTVTKVYPKSTMIFVEGQPSRGVYMLCQGKVKLSTCSQDGKIIILGIAAPGDLLGLTAAMNGTDYEMTAEVVELCQVNYVSSSELLNFLHTNGNACLNAAKQLSRNYHTAYQQICSLGLSDSVADKLAKLFLEWSGNGTGGNGRVHLKNFFTHEEMAEMIGSSRETVTRVLKAFREHDLITLKGSDLVIHDRKRLKAAIGNRGALRIEL